MQFMHPMRTTRQNEDGTHTVTVTPPAIIGGEPQSITLTEEQFSRYEQWCNKGVLIQHVLYDLTDDQRELLMTGLTPKVFDSLAPDE